MVYLELGLLVVFILVLAKASAVVVEHASRLAKFFRVSDIAVGILLVALSTSLPEFAVAISSAAAGEGAISAGNVFGSNIANIFLVFGLGALLYGVRIPKKEISQIGMLLLLTIVLSSYIIMSSLVLNRALGVIEGIILLSVFGFYAFNCMQGCTVPTNSAKDVGISRKEAFFSFAWFGASVIVVMFSAEIVVSNAVTVAREFGIAESLIGATMIAVGTSLPEISIDLAAFRKRKYGLAIGDALGSNVANLTFVLGTGAVLSEIRINLAVFIAALLFAIVANALLFYYAALRKDMARNSGILLLGMYAVFLITIFALQAGELGVV